MRRFPRLDIRSRWTSTTGFGLCHDDFLNSAVKFLCPTHLAELKFRTSWPEASLALTRGWLALLAI